jgi:hypothetical protein
MSTAVFGAPEFKARSGRSVRSNEDGSVTFEGVRGYIGAEQVFDAQEFFQAQRDLDFGRWRCPAEPDWVAQEGERSSDGRRTVRLFNESTFESFWLNSRVMDEVDNETAKHRVARAFFESHPERKPWHSAKDDEVWVLTHVKGEVGAFVVDGHRFVSGSWSFPIDGESITEGRCIWPEDAS